MFIFPLFMYCWGINCFFCFSGCISFCQDFHEKYASHSRWKGRFFLGKAVGVSCKRIVDMQSILQKKTDNSKEDYGLERMEYGLKRGEERIKKVGFVVKE